MCDLQLHDEYELDKQQAMDRITCEVERSIMNMRNSIEHTCEQQRDALIRRLELEQRERLTAVKRRQWVCIILLLINKCSTMSKCTLYNFMCYCIFICIIYV